MSWRAAVPVAAFALFIVGGLLLWFVSLVWQYNSTAQAQETEDCANAQVVNRFTGTGNQGTDPFEATGPFQLTYDLTAAGSANVDEPSLNIYVYDQQSGQIVADASQEGEGTGGSLSTCPRVLTLYRSLQSTASTRRPWSSAGAARQALIRTLAPPRRPRQHRVQARVH